MPSFNKVIIMGNLTRDPEIKYTPSGKAVCEISLAVSERWTDADGNKKESCAFIGCVVWGRQAEVLAQYCQKGTCLHIEGKIVQDTWEDKETGKKREKTKVQVEQFRFVGGTKNQDDAPAERPQRPAAQPAPSDDDSDEIPF